MTGKQFEELRTQLGGKTKVEIALKVKAGEVDAKDATSFIAERETRKFTAILAKA